HVWRRTTLFFDEHGSITDGNGCYYDQEGKPEPSHLHEERERRGQEAAGIAAIQQETGLDRDSARLLYHHRNPRHIGGGRVLMRVLSDHEVELCEQLETRLAAKKADRLVNGGNVDWSLRDRHRERAGAQETGATGAAAQPQDVGSLEV